jgi:diacylglycerol O-acyltransferase
VAPIGGRVRLTVAVWSYSDQLTVGITGDADSVPDIDVLRRGISRGFRALVEAARSTDDTRSHALDN